MEANGGGDHALPNGALPIGVVRARAVAMPNPDVLYLVFIRLPVREIARCRWVCRLWRDITRTEAFRRDHHRHPCRTPMPLYSFRDPVLARVNFRAIDTRDRVSLPVLRFPSHHHEAVRIHGSCAGILLVSSGHRLYACNPCTRRWAHLPPLHVFQHIIGFYTDGVRFQVLTHDRREADCTYWVYGLGAAAPPPTPIGRPVDEVDLQVVPVLANGVVFSYTTPPVSFLVYLCWLPQAAPGNSDILMFDTGARTFGSIPSPTILVNGEDIPVGMGAQLLEIDGHLAMTVISPARLDVWVRCNATDLWSRRHRIILLQVDVNNINVFAVAQNSLALCPYILRVHHRQILLSRHTIQESLLLHPSILPLQDTDAVDGDPPFFQNP